MDGETGTDDATSAMTGGGFIYGDPTGGQPNACDTWEQDCDDGEKCNPWASDGGDLHNATRCSPVADETSALGESCVVEGNFVSGIDNCEVGAVCARLQAGSVVGVCVELCSGSAADPVCTETTDGTCVVVSQLYGLCGATCAPSSASCDDGQSCYPADEAWGCATAGDTPVGEPCSLGNECVAGSVCSDADSLCPEGESACCSQVCDLSAPDPDAACSEGRTCEAFYEPGTAPKGYESVGLCWAE